MRNSAKRISPTCLFIFGLLLLFPVAVSAEIVFKMNHQFPKTAAGSKIDQWFVDEVKRATRGEVEIRIFWSNALGEPRENLTLLRYGVIDMAAMSAGYFPTELPLHSAPNSIPMGMDNVCQASIIMKAFSTRIPAFEEEAADHKIRPLFFHLLNPYLLISKKPVTKFSDLKGMRIRTWGKDMPRLIEAAEGKSVPLFLPDIYEALKSRVIDGCPFSVDLMVSYKIYELAGHVTEVVLWEGPSWGIWIGEKSWEKLSPKHRKVMLDVAEKARRREIPATLASEKTARRFLIERGLKFHRFPASELDKWKSANPDFFGDFVEKMEKKGKGDAARQMVELWKNLRRKTVKCP
ncbi:MAG: hypothetical protein GY866_10055 [Proteobacteria bacterium]|nr:hypothetical protein [Pseudomonadota bacterium]